MPQNDPDFRREDLCQHDIERLYNFSFPKTKLVNNAQKPFSLEVHKSEKWLKNLPKILDVLLSFKTKSNFALETPVTTNYAKLLSQTTNKNGYYSSHLNYNKKEM